MNRKHSRHMIKNKSDKILIVISAMCVIGFGIGLFFSNTNAKKREAGFEKQNTLYTQKKKEEAARVDSILKNINSAYIGAVPGIVCWGDSLTADAGGNSVSYPDVLHACIKKNVTRLFNIDNIVYQSYKYGMSNSVYKPETPEVINMGVGGENTVTILGRNGAIPFVVSQSFVIPANPESVKISFKSKTGDKVYPLKQGEAGINNVTIRGIEGALTISEESTSEPVYYFKRQKAGESVSVPVGETIQTAASSKYLDHITVIFIGQNGGWDNPAELVSQQKAIINHQSSNRDKFIIIGLHTGTLAQRIDLENVMLKEYGDHYINLRAYMSTQALTDARIDATKEDIEMMELGMTPASLLSDRVHFKSIGYELLGKLVYNRMDQLGYFNRAKEAIASAAHN